MYYKEVGSAFTYYAHYLSRRRRRSLDVNPQYGETFVMQAPNATEVEVGNLPAFRMYTIRIAAAGRKGEGTPSGIFYAATGESSK